jgi:hypothetical protein
MHVRRRNRIVHAGENVDASAAQESLKAARHLCAFVEARLPEDDDDDEE